MKVACKGGIPVGGGCREGQAHTGHRWLDFAVMLLYTRTKYIICEFIGTDVPCKPGPRCNKRKMLYAPSLGTYAIPAPARTNGTPLVSFSRMAFAKGDAFIGVVPFIKVLKGGGLFSAEWGGCSVRDLPINWMDVGLTLNYVMQCSRINNTL